MRVFEHPVFLGVDPDRVARRLKGRTSVEVPKGQLLSGPAKRPAHLHLLLEGELASFELTAGGKQLLMEIIEPGGIEGLLWVAGLHGPFTEARQRSVVFPLARSDLDGLLDEEPVIARNLLQMILHRLERREEQLHSLAHREPTQRLARQLLALGDYLGIREGNEIVLRSRLTHQALADMLGLRRETITYHLHVLERAGAVRLGQAALVLKVGSLEAIVSGQPD
ncbi:MAG: Crp/Fnr family transcriptional regulator [Candidatus Dormibacteraeota bacterium]|nr:Crp/Fnr family transcriptional regulator [Candidatus Dormibacteraeota bacterium]